MNVLAVFGIDNSGLDLAVKLLVLFLVVLWLALIYYTFSDARRRIADPLLVGCATAASLFPFVGTTMNDNIIRHYSYGGELAYYLTDVLAVGVEGQGFAHSFREPFDLIARQARRLPTVNQYNWSAALNFHYVPVYGKFAILDHKLITWESFFTAGIGVGQSEVIPRDTKFPGFTNLLIQPNIGVAMRFFLTRWLTVNLGFRDYIFFDHFEPQNRANDHFATAADAKAHADGSLINNVMFQIGVSFWIPTTFEYTTFR